MSPLGAGALAGTSLPIDPHRNAEDLGFAAVFANSLDVTSDRDFIAESLFAVAMIGIHLSRIGEEVVLWSSEEFGFLTLDDAYATGSSMMPQKKNPDIAELARGKSGRLIGNLTGLLATLKSLPLAYNRDLQEDKEPVFDAVDTVSASLSIIAELLENLKFNTEKMIDATKSGFMTATDLADYLVLKDVPFREAHGIVGRIVSYCIDRGCELVDLTVQDMQQFSPVIEKDVYEVISIDGSVQSRISTGGTSLQRVEEALRAAEKQVGIA